MMKRCVDAGVWAVLLLIGTIPLFLSAVGESLRLPPDAETISNGRMSLKEHKNHMMSEEGVDKDLLKGLEATTGSSLPDCSHACGPCLPCRRVMVSFKCSIAESCPIVYQCMCKGKYYHVPFN